MRTIKEILKLILPSFIIGLFQKKIWHGNYSSYAEALSNSKGYDKDNILEKIIFSSRQVRDGKAVFERDSVLFSKIEYSFGLLSALLLSVTKDKELIVIDFGGSLGTSYYQNKIIEKSGVKLDWNVVEQEHFVNVGEKEFERENLHFYSTIEECLNEKKVNVLILSSVAQYMEAPHEFIEKLLSFDFDHIIIDRTGFIAEERADLLTIQEVPSSIYEGSYPCWFFNKKKFLAHFTGKYELVFDWPALDQADVPSAYEGFYLRKNV